MEKIGKWTIISIEKNYALCTCECGVTRKVNYYSLTHGGSKSCGCLRSEASRNTHTTHGMSYNGLHNTWSKMKNRCNNPNYHEYHLYGGRGIKVCARWGDYKNFVLDMGLRPKGMTLDRIDNDGDYSPENCRWVTQKENNRNKRNSVFLTWKGVTLHIAEWAEKIGLNYKTLKTRYHQGWGIDRMLSTPPRGDKTKKQYAFNVLKELESGGIP